MQDLQYSLQQPRSSRYANLIWYFRFELLSVPMQYFWSIQETQEIDFSNFINKKLFFYNFSLAEHKKFHKNGKFTCDICNVRFSQSSFIWHQRRVHPEVQRNSRQCKICKASFSTTYSLSTDFFNYLDGKFSAIFIFYFRLPY